VYPPRLAALRRFAARPPAPDERCDLCAAALAPDHIHLLEPMSRRIICACEACAAPFGRGTPGGGRYRQVPRRVEFWPEFRLAEGRWDSLRLPIDLAFFFHSTPRGRVIAMYPSPAGATESLLDLETWREVVEENPRLAELEPDVEALLVNRLGGAAEHYRAPIDECFRLVGVIRSRWRGLSGGTEVRKRIARFFADLRARSDGEHGRKPGGG
jgi:uncharacterized protein DUF5947